MNALPSLTTAAHEFVVPRSMPMIGPLRGPAGRSGTTSSTICGVASAGDVLSTLSRVGRGRGGGAGLRAGGGRDGTFFARPSLAFFGSSAEPVWRAASDGDSGSPHTSWSASGTTCSASSSVRRDCADAGAESAGLDAGGAVSESVDSGSAGCAGTARLTSCTAPSFCGCAGGGGRSCRRRRPGGPGGRRGGRRPRLS